MAAGGIVEIEVKPDLSKFGAELQAGVEEAAGGAEESSKGIGLAIAAGAAIAGTGLAAIIALGNEYQGTLNEIQAVSGATGETMAQVGTRAKELGSDVTLAGVSAADAAGAMLELAKGGLSVDEAMAAAKGTLQLAGAAQIDGARAAEIQATSLNQFGLAASDAGRVADTLANTANAASGSIEDIALAMKYVGPVAASMSISIEDTSTAIGLLANSGIQADNAGTSLRGMLASLAAPSLQAKGAIKNLGIQAFDSKGNFVGFRDVIGQLSTAQGKMTEEQFASNAAMAFGREPLAAIVALASAGTPAFDSMREAVGKQGGAADVAAAKMKGLGGAMEGFQSNLETAAISIYEIIAGPLESLVRTATSVVDVMNDIFSGEIDLTQFSAVNSVIETSQQLWGNLIGIFDNVKAAVIPVYEGIKDVAKALSGDDGGVNAVATGIQLLGDAAEFASGLLVPLGQAVGTLLTLFSGLPSPIQLVVLALLALKVGPAIIGTMMSALRGVPVVGTAAANALGRVGTGFTGAGTAASGAVGSVMRFGDQMKVQAALAAANGTAVGKFGAALATLIARSPAVAAMAQSFRTVSTAVAGFGASAGTGIRTATESLARIPAAVSSAATAVRTGFTGAATSAATAFRNIPTAATSAFNGVRTAVTSAATATASAFRAIPAAATTAFGSVRTAASTAATGVLTAVRGIPTGIASAFRGIPAALQTGVTAIGRFAGTIAGVGAGIGTGLLRGLGSLTSFLGGPWGIALTGAMVFLTLFTGSQQKAKAAAQEHQAALDALSGTLDKYNGAITQSTVNEKASQLAKDGTLKKVQELGISVEDYTRASLGEAESLSRVKTQLNEHTKGLIAGTTAYQTSGPALQKFGISLQDLADAASGSQPAIDKVTEATRRAGDGNANYTRVLSQAVAQMIDAGSASADLAKDLGISNGEMDKLTEQTQLAAQASGEFGATLDFLKQGLGGLKDGGIATDVLATGFTKLAASAGTAANAAGEAAAKIGGVKAGGDQAAASMEKSRQAFIDAAGAAGIGADQAGALATQIGLIPEVARIAFETNANVVQTDFLTLNSQIAAVPDAKSITVNTLSAAAIQNLREIGIEVNTLPNGQIEINVKDDAGRQKLEAFLTTMNTATAAPKMDLNTATAQQKADGMKSYMDGLVGVAKADADAAPGTAKANDLKKYMDGITGILKADANPAPGTAKANELQGYMNGLVGVLTADANNAPGTAKGDALRGYINGLIAIMTADANSAPGTAKGNALKAFIDRLVATLTATANTGAAEKALNYTARERTAIINGVMHVTGPGSQEFNQAQGGILSAMHDGGVVGFANGGTAQRRKLTPMRGGIATIVPPNSWRVVGDRLKDDEAYIPINGSKRSRKIFEEVARRMGYAATRHFADGGFAERIRSNVLSSVQSQRSTSARDLRELISEIVRSVEGSARGDINIELTANNPVAEPASATLTRNIRTLSQMGAFG